MHETVSAQSNQVVVCLARSELGRDRVAANTLLNLDVLVHYFENSVSSEYPFLTNVIAAPAFLSAEDITIAVTVYSRSEYVLSAIETALAQTIPVKVLVVEDCSPNPVVRRVVTSRFGDRVAYVRNEANRGLFDNWNACMEYCSTPWLSILHDDDLLLPRFVETMLKLSKEAPDRSLYFGHSSLLRPSGEVESLPNFCLNVPWQEIDPIKLADFCFLTFPGQLFRVADAKAVGGVRKHSLLTGDWDLWLKLVLYGGGAQSATEVSLVRSHYGEDRGTTKVERSGWKYALDNMQRKRNLALIRKQLGITVPFERAAPFRRGPLPTSFLFRYARNFSIQVLNYNAWLLRKSRSPHFPYRVLQVLVTILGPRVLRWCSIVWNWVQGRLKRHSA